MIIGLTGKRGVGKSTIAKILVENGWRSAHAFAPGKEICKAYYRHLGASPEVAQRMVDGDLKDEPSRFLPDVESSRYFMERLGHWMATNPELGPAWTLGVELERLQRIDSNAPIVIESVVYEADLITRMGGRIIRIERKKAGDWQSAVGDKTDRGQAQIECDLTFINRSAGLDSLRVQVQEFFDSNNLNSWFE